MLFKEIVDGRTHARTDARTTDDGRRTLKDHKSSLSTSCSGELTRGPRGPWVAHLRKRSQATVEPIIENPRGIIWTTLVEDLQMMLFTKFESSGPCCFKQEDFCMFHFKTYLLTLWPTYATNWNGLNNSHRGPPRNHSCEVWSNSH